MTSRLQHFSFRSLLIISSLLRVGLVVYSDWHDAHSVVKYTDVDYRVFSDAVRFLLNPGGSDTSTRSAGVDYNLARGPLGPLLGAGDPYTRETYRYTPLLALLLAPNEWLHPSFGKYLFAACDILAGVLLHRLLVSSILPNCEKERTSHTPGPAATSARLGKDAVPRDNPTATLVDGGGREQRATLLTALHLLNPMVFAISTRGSSEAVLLLLVLAALSAALRARWGAAAALLGLATHWKIYPLVYGATCVGVIGGEAGARGWGRIVNAKTVRFGAIAVGTFVGLGVAMYGIWGYPFLHESYLYHLHRRDHRHNFSPYFYLAYLTYPAHASALASAPVILGLRRLLRSPVVSFVPQMALALGTGLAFGRHRADLPFAWFVQTFVFVVFNKVCTSQYFLWYLLFVPLIAPRVVATLGMRRGALVLAAWVGTQALWLTQAFRLEFGGENVFLSLWACGLLYVVGNCWVLGEVVKAYAC